MINIKTSLKTILTICGFIALILGIIGIFVPLLPTTPFILLSLACFSRSSKTFYNKVLQNKWIGGYIENYYQGKGIPIKAKAFLLFTLWVTISLSMFLLGIFWIRLLLGVIAVSVTIHLLLIKTQKNES